jgi:hypothetical protein
LLKNAANRIVLLESLRRIPRHRIKELWIQGVLLGILESRVGYMRLEYQVGKGRIDFYHKGNPHSAIELAVVSGKWIYQHTPRINAKEIEKLRSISHPKNVRRFLLLIDLKSKKPLNGKRLADNYAGYFKNNKARIIVIYVHKDSNFNFVC